MRPEPRRGLSLLDAAHLLDPALWVRDRLGLSPDPWQEEALRSLAAEVYILAARQSGKTETMAWRVAHLLAHYNGATCIAIAPSQRQSAELVRRTASALDRAEVALEVRNAYGLETRHGSRLIAVPGGEDAAGARGYTAALVVVDEGCFTAEAVVAAVRPMLAVTRGTFVAISSAGPAASWFARRWQESVEDPAVLRLSITADLNPRILPDFLARERRALGEARFAAEYLNVFSTPGSRWFDADSLERLFGAPTMGPEPDEVEADTPGRPALPQRDVHNLFNARRSA